MTKSGAEVKPNIIENKHSMVRMPPSNDDVIKIDSKFKSSKEEGEISHNKTII